MNDLTDDPRTPDEVLEDEARARKDEKPDRNPAAAGLPDDVRTEPIDHGDDDGSTVDHHEGE